MQKACGHPRRGSHSLGAHDFRVCFTPLKGVLFTFPSRYLCTIGRQPVFSLGGWAPRIQTGFHVSRPTWDTCRLARGFRARGFHPLRRRFPAACANASSTMARSRNPAGHARRFGLLRVRSPLLAESPPGTEMFHFPGCGLRTLWIHARMTPDERRRIAPFGNPRIKGRLRLPVDYRGLPRPSSPAVAKASIMRPNNLTVKITSTESSRLCASPPPPRLGSGGLSLLLLFFFYCCPGCQRAAGKDDRHPEPDVIAVVGAPGLEPGASSLSETRSNQLSYAPAPGPDRGNPRAGDRQSRSSVCPVHGRHTLPGGAEPGGAGGTRTRGILLAKQALYH